MIGSLGPQAIDGSPFVSPCMFPAGVYLYITGSSDGTVIGEGDQFVLTSEEEEDKSFEFQFQDWVLIAGGGLFPTGAVRGDWASMGVYCPATPITPNVGGTGNCNLVNGIIVPAAGDGAYDVDLGEANPVLTPLHDGFWDWDFPPTGKGTVTVGEPQKAKAHLIAANYDLARFVNRVSISKNEQLEFTIPAIEPKIMLPHWKGKVTIHNSGHTGLAVEWYITCARARTV